ncbi:MAG: type I methionyl aminopeptidase [Candidatus Omnitrophica bacterium]|nr:type I methionyl aminopeptidase [Candidatus Omnitrophota bacterium]
MISLKSKREVEIMRESGKILASVLSELSRFVKPGLRTLDIDKKASELIREKGGEPAFKGYRGYPANVCISVNEEVVHGIPSSRKLKEGDIVSVDAGVKYQGYFTDAARTWPVGEVPAEIRKMIRVTRDSLYKAGLEKMRPGMRLGDISHAIQKFIEAEGYGVVRDFVGHGIGRAIHEEPQVPNFGKPGRGIPLEAGLVLAVEPMVTQGGFEVEILDDNWTVVTSDGKLASHHEDTIAITESGPEVLTYFEE